MRSSTQNGMRRWRQGVVNGATQADPTSPLGRLKKQQLRTDCFVLACPFATHCVGRTLLVDNSGLHRSPSQVSLSPHAAEYRAAPHNRVLNLSHHYFRLFILALLLKHACQIVHTPPCVWMLPQSWHLLPSHQCLSIQ